MMKDEYISAREVYAKRGMNAEAAIDATIGCEILLTNIDESLLPFIPGNTDIALVSSIRVGASTRRRAAELGKERGKPIYAVLELDSEMSLTDAANVVYADRYDHAFISDAIFATSSCDARLVLLAVKAGITPVITLNSKGDIDKADDMLCALTELGFSPALYFRYNVSFDYALSELIGKLQESCRIILEASGKDVLVAARSLIKAILYANLTGKSSAHRAKERGEAAMSYFLREEEKTLPFYAVWQEYLRRSGSDGNAWIERLKSL